MPTEAFRILNSQSSDDNGGVLGARISREFDGEKSNDICVAVYDALVAAGWQAAGGTKASWSLALPFGVPVTTVPDVPVEDPPTVTGGANVVTCDGIAITFYDPFRSIPADMPGVQWVEMDIMAAGSVANLAAAVVTHGWVYLGSHYDTLPPFVDWLHLDFEAPEIGLAWNAKAFGGGGDVSSAVQSNWYWGFLADVGAVGGPWGNAPGGGGYYLRSYQGAAYLEVWLGIPETGSSSATFRFDASVEGGTEPALTLATSSDKFRIIANQFQFFIFEDDTDAVGLMAIFPKLAADKGVEYGAVVCASAYRRALQWPAQSAANSGFTRIIGHDAYAGSTPGFHLIKFPGVEVKDVQLRRVAQTAHITATPNGAPNDVTGQARVIGVAWDAVIVAGLYDLGARIIWRGLAWECIGRQDGGPYAAHASVWIAYGLPGENI